MKIGVLGTGMVGQAIAAKLAQQGHDVMMGSRNPQKPSAAEFVKRSGGKGQAGSLVVAAAFGTVLFNCTPGAKTLEILHAIGKEHLSGKVLVDVANVIPPSARESESLGVLLQRAFPET
jgi:predicted dinucleotide-binding enzyme